MTTPPSGSPTRQASVPVSSGRPRATRARRTRSRALQNGGESFSSGHEVLFHVAVTTDAPDTVHWPAQRGRIQARMARGIFPSRPPVFDRRPGGRGARGKGQGGHDGSITTSVHRRSSCRRRAQARRVLPQRRRQRLPEIARRQTPQMQQRHGNLRRAVHIGRRNAGEPTRCTLWREGGAATRRDALRVSAQRGVHHPPSPGLAWRNTTFGYTSTSDAASRLCPIWTLPRAQAPPLG